MIAAHAKVKWVQCSICKTKVCFNCREKWHLGSCKDNLHKVYTINFGHRKNFSWCPMCFTPIERIKGCNHITCEVCGFEFCWICQRDATENSGHWKEFSLTGCGVG